MPLQRERLSAPPNQLAHKIESIIDTAENAITFRDYMNYSLYGVGEVAGYYTDGNAQIGDRDRTISKERVDFSTPAEATPLYGYTLAKQILEMREVIGNPRNFTVMAMGEGNGTLMHDVVFGIYKLAPKDFRKINFVAVEKSPTFSVIQKQLYSKTPANIEVINASAINISVSPFEGVIFSVELPDVIPTHIIRKIGKDYKELFISKGDTNTFSAEWGLLSSKAKSYLNRVNPTIPDNYMYGASPDTFRWQQNKSEILETGFDITIDYDWLRVDEGRFPATIESAIVKKTNSRSDLDLILDKRFCGKIDISCGVDFQMLSDASRLSGMRTEGYVMNSGWLWGLGYDLLEKDSTIQIPGRTRHSLKESALRNSNHWNVLIQSKGISGKTSFNSLRYPGNPDTWYEDPNFKNISY